MHHLFSAVCILLEDPDLAFYHDKKSFGQFSRDEQHLSFS